MRSQIQIFKTDSIIIKQSHKIKIMVVLLYRLFYVQSSYLHYC
jgi:hypothetical protein